MGPSTFAVVRGRTIRRLREAAKLTQKELADKAGYGAGGRVALAKVEHGRAEPTADRLAGICETLNVSQDGLDRAAAALLLEESRQRGASSSTVPDLFLRAAGGPEAVDNVHRQRAVAEEAEYLQRETHARFEVSMIASENARDRLVDPFMELAARVPGLSSPAGQPRPPGPALTLDARVRESVRELGEVSMSMATGIRVVQASHQIGVASGHAVYGAVGAYARASTGAAIAGLNGAAKQKATLAWLGGGSLATNGRGIAGGELVLKGIVALPVLIATGGLLVFKTMQLRAQVKDDAARLTEAERTQAAQRDELSQAWAWADEQADILTELATQGAGLLEDLDHRLPGAEIVEWASLDYATQQRLQRALALVSAVWAIDALSVWSMMSTTEAEPALGVKETNADWIAAVLQHGRDLTQP